MSRSWLWVSLVEVFLVSAILASPVLAGGPFRENFSGRSLRGREWAINLNGGDVMVAGGVLNTSAFRSSSFPYVHTASDPFASFNDFTVKVGFFYPSVTNYGTGVVLDTGTPSNGALAASYAPVMSVWQDWTNGLTITFAGQEVYRTGVTKAYHDLRMDYGAGVYTLYLDESLIYTSGQTTVRPSSIWIGNYQPIGHLDDWTDLAIDYVTVTGPGH